MDGRWEIMIDHSLVKQNLERKELSEVDELDSKDLPCCRHSCSFQVEACSLANSVRNLLLQAIDPRIAIERCCMHLDDD